jgi:hypothetical protein
VEAYQQSMLSWVEKLMQSGADGLFVDAIPGSLTLPPSPCLSPCYAGQAGPEFQQFHHQHIFGYNPADLTAATAAQQKAFSLLLERVRSIVYKHGGKVLGNTALPFQYTNNQGSLITTFHFTNLDPFIENGVLPFLDADMMEQFLNLSDCQPSPGLTVQHRWNGYWYPYIQAVLKVFNKPEFRGKQVLVIPPNPFRAQDVGQCLPPNITSTVRGYQFLTYVAARLAGFIRFVGPLGCYADFKLTPPAGPPLTYQQAMQDQFGDLARLRLGPPITGILTDSSSNVFYRLFESGLVALNSDMSTSRPLIVSGPGNFQTPNPPFPTTKFLDLTDPIGTSGAWTHLEIIDVTKTSGALTIPPLSGRVYLFGAETSYLLA